MKKESASYDSGFSLLELIISCAIGGIVLLYFAMWFSSVQTSLGRTQARVNGQQAIGDLVADFRTRFRNRSGVPTWSAGGAFAVGSNCGDITILSGPFGAVPDRYVYETVCTSVSGLPFRPTNFEIHPSLNCPAGQLPSVRVTKNGTPISTFPKPGMGIAMAACFKKFATSPCPAAIAPCPDYFTARISTLYASGNQAGIVGQTFSTSTLGRRANVLFLPP